MPNSTHKVEVGRVTISPHPNADRLEVATIHGYTSCVKKGDFKTGDLVAFLPPDSVVDTGRDEFAFLLDKARIKAKKLRGVLSFGLVVPAPVGSAEGDDVAEVLGVTHYDPPIRGQRTSPSGVVIGGEAVEAPHVWCPKYDLEAGRRYAAQVFTPKEQVVITEKVHGANARYVFWNGQMYCGSRTEWKREYPDFSHVTVPWLMEKGVSEDKAQEIEAKYRANHRMQKNIWWQAKDKHPEIEEFCRTYPSTVLFGEVYGAVQDLNYGHEKGDVSFIAFDVLDKGNYRDPTHSGYDGKCVPRVWVGEYDFDLVCLLAEGPSLLHPGHVREGVVVKPLVERTHPSIGRVALKWVGAGYLERA